jgi:hypothetical protein
MDVYDLLKKVRRDLNVDGRTKAARAQKKRVLAAINAAQTKLWQRHGS